MNESALRARQTSNAGSRLLPPAYLTSFRSMSAKKRKKTAAGRDGLPSANEGVAAWAPALWYLAAALTFWSFGYTTMRGSDLWWHLAGGRWMWEHGAVWVADPFSFTAAGKEWLNDAWLSGVFLYLWTEWLNLESLAYWKWLMIVATWLLLFRLAWRMSGDAAGSFLACLLSIAVAAPFLDVRPQLYSFLAWVVMLDMCLARDRPSAWLPLVMLLWVNLHAGFFLGLISLPILLLPHWLEAGAGERRRVAVIGTLAAVACLVNPNGIEVVTRPLLHAFDTASPYRTLGEWLPPFRRGGIQSPMFPYGIAAFAVAALVSVWTIWKSRARVAAAVPLALAGLTLAMALQSRRFVPIFAVTEVLVVAPALAYAGAALVRRIPAYAPALVALGLGIWLMSGRPVASWAFDDLVARDTFPIDTCGFIRANELSGKTFAYYNWGGFVQLCTEGRMKVFIDGRAETVYDDATFLDYLTVLQGRPGWETVIERSGADFVLWPLNAGRVVKDLGASSQWRPVYRDAVSVLFARVDVPLPRELRASPESPYRDLSLGLHELQAGRSAQAVSYFESALARDPHMFLACTVLVRTHVLAGDFNKAHATVDRCSAGMTDGSRVDELRAFVDTMRARAGNS